MWPYTICTIFSCWFTYLDTITRKKKMDRIGIFGWIAIIIPSLLAGFRDSGVGTDTSGYGDIVFCEALSSGSFIQFIRSDNLFVMNVEILYKVFVYVISRFTHNIACQYFFIEFVITGFIYKAILESELKKYSCFAMLVYFLAFYSFSFNLMRQMIAMSFVLWGYRYIRKKQFKKYIIVIFIATLIHTMAIVSVAVFILNYLCNISLSDVGKTGTYKIKKFLARYRKIINCMIAAIAIGVIIFADKLILMASVIKGSYMYQLVNLTKERNYSYSVLLFMLAIFIPFVLLKSKIKDKGKIALFNFYSMVILISAILWQLAGVSRESYRVCLYLWVMVIIAVPQLVMQLNGKNRILLGGYYLILFNAYYYYMFVLILVNETYPYTSKILGIT